MGVGWSVKKKVDKKGDGNCVGKKWGNWGGGWLKEGGRKGSRGGNGGNCEVGWGREGEHGAHHIKIHVWKVRGPNSQLA